MSNVPAELRYTRTHEWVRKEQDGTVTTGITDHAQDLLGDLVFIELPETGRVVKAGEECAVVESVKAASDIYSPLTGEIIETNPAVADHPEVVNKDPYGEGWLFRLRPSEDSEWENLLDPDAYSGVAAAEEGH